MLLVDYEKCGLEEEEEDEDKEEADEGAIAGQRLSFA